MAAPVAGVVEEVIFRGYLMTAPAEMGYGPLAQVLVSGIAFAVAHVYGFGSPGTLLAMRGLIFVLGLALGLVYVVGKRRPDSRHGVARGWKKTPKANERESVHRGLILVRFMDIIRTVP